MFDLTFNVEDKGALTPLTLAIDQAVIAGWTGRDPVARDKHIAELEAMGVARPATTPIYYRCSARRITLLADRIEVSEENSSGEVEFVLIGWQGRIFVGCGCTTSTDRKVEAYSVTVSKQMCDKPVAPVLWELEDVIAHWDKMILRSWAIIGGVRVLYQEGTLDAMPVKDLIERGFGGKGLPDGCAMFGGTFAAKGGIRPASRFEFELEDPVLKRKISHGYDVIEMPVLG